MRSRGCATPVTRRCRARSRRPQLRRRSRRADLESASRRTSGRTSPIERQYGDRPAEPRPRAAREPHAARRPRSSCSLAFQSALEFAARAEQSRLHRPVRDSERMRDLRDRPLLHVVKHEDRPCLDRDAPECPAERIALADLAIGRRRDPRFDRAALADTSGGASPGTSRQALTDPVAHAGNRSTSQAEAAPPPATSASCGRRTRRLRCPGSRRRVVSSQPAAPRSRRRRLRHRRGGPARRADPSTAPPCRSPPSSHQSTERSDRFTADESKRRASRLAVGC